VTSFALILPELILLLAKLNYQYTKSYLYFSYLTNTTGKLKKKNQSADHFSWSYTVTDEDGKEKYNPPNFDF